MSIAYLTPSHVPSLMNGGDRSGERPSPLNLPPSRPSSAINLVSDEAEHTPTSPVAKPHPEEISPKTIVERTRSVVPEQREEEPRITSRKSLPPGRPIVSRSSLPPIPTHRLQTPWPKRDSIVVPSASPPDNSAPAPAASEATPDPAPRSPSVTEVKPLSVSSKPAAASPTPAPAAAAQRVQPSPATHHASPKRPSALPSKTEIPYQAARTRASNASLSERLPPLEQKREPLNLPSIPEISPMAPRAIVNAQAQVQPRRGSMQGEPAERKASTAASISCAYCTATGVNASWRRDRSGKPLCGKCCDQLRRRMNPRYQAAPPAAARAPAERPAGRMSIGHAPLRRSPSPPGKAPVPRTGAALASHPYRPNVFDDSRRRSMPYRTNGMPPGPPSSTMDRFRREDLESMQRLPPLSTIERMADGYGQAPRLSVHSPDRRMSRFAERPAPASEIPTEAEVRERRTLLVEGRRWILDMLDDTTSMLRQLDNATLHPGS